MRKLTILRRKSFVACLAKMDVYFEDRVNPTTTINDIPCRLLGKMKNGETVTYDIPNEGGMLFVTCGGKMSRSICTEALPIFPGETDIFLSGQNEYSYVGGNAFRFDGVNNEVTNANRAATQKKSLKVFFITLAVAVVVGLIIGFAGALIPSEPETFTAGDFSITLTDDFYDYNEDGYLASYESDDYFVMVERIKYSELNDYDDAQLAAVESLEDFANYYEDMEAEGYTNTKALTKEGNLYYYEYEYSEFFLTYHYGQYFFEYDGAYYSVLFGAEESDYNAEEVKAWAESITFGE